MAVRSIVWPHDGFSCDLETSVSKKSHKSPVDFKMTRHYFINDFPGQFSSLLQDIMLFLWSKEPTPDPRAGPWFAWFATAVLLWRCRRRITKAILAISPLRLLKRRAAGLAINQKMILKQQKRHSLAQLHKHKTVGIRRTKRLCTGDGPHVSGMSMIQAGPQIHYRVTRSGRIYGKYPNKTAILNGSIQESH